MSADHESSQLEHQYTVCKIIQKCLSLWNIAQFAWILFLAAKLKWDILRDFHTLCTKLIGTLMHSEHESRKNVSFYETSQFSRMICADNIFGIKTEMRHFGWFSNTVYKISHYFWQPIAKLSVKLYSNVRRFLRDNFPFL